MGRGGARPGAGRKSTWKNKTKGMKLPARFEKEIFPGVNFSRCKFFVDELAAGAAKADRGRGGSSLPPLSN